MKKVKKHEPQTVKEDPKKLARRLRAQKRRERQASEDAAAKAPARKPPQRVEKEEIRRKSSSILSSRIPEPEEESVLSLVELNGMVSPNLNFIRFCKMQYGDLVENLVARGMTPWLAVDVPDLHEKLKNKEIEPLYYSFDWLIRLAVKAIGVESLKKFHCPICAFMQHDYINQVAEALQQAIASRIK